MLSKLLFAGLFLARDIAANLAGLEIQAFVEPGCNQGGQFTYFSLGTGYPGCVTNYFGNTGFQKVGSSYNATFLIPDPGDGCQIFIRAPSNVDDPGCGEIIHTFTQSECSTLVFPDPFDLNFCCGESDCSAAVPVGSPSNKMKRSQVQDIENLRTRNVFEKKRRSGNCAYSGATPVTEDGQAQSVSNNINCLGGSNCTETFMGSVETSSTNTFGVSESVEVDLFEIIQSTTEFSYMYSYTTSHSVAMSYSYTVPAGDSGDLTWTPTLQCTTGTFSGSDCQGSGIPTGQSGTACVPVTEGSAASGTPQGTFNFDAVN